MTISLDSLDDEVFRKMNGRNFGVDTVLKGIEAAERVGLTPIKINAVVQRGMNDHTLVDMARHFKERGHILRFIEYMDVGTLNGWRMDDVVPAERIVSMIDAELPLRTHRGELPRRGRKALPLQGRHGRDRRHRVRDPALLRRLHTDCASRRRAAS